MPSLLPSPPPSPFEPPSTRYYLVNFPLHLLASTLHRTISLLRGPPYPPPSPTTLIRLVCISDTHTHIPVSLPTGHVLIHAGDLTNLGTVEEIQAQIDWLDGLDYKYKLAIAGNHDSYLDPRSRYKSDEGKELDWKSVKYLQHDSTTLHFPDRGDRRLMVYGAPQIPKCGGSEFAFQYQRQCDAWNGVIPPETDILITHTPPRFHLDLPRGMGCEFLLGETWKVRPRVHVFGHVHAGSGRETVFWDESQRSYERISAKAGRGLIKDLIAIWSWLDVIRLVAYGLLGVLWNRVWGADEEGTVMINAALMYRGTGKLGNKPQVVEI